MADDNDYEAARKRRVRENLKRFEDLGISSISKSLKEVGHHENRILSHHTNSSKKGLDTSELRRSSRSRITVLSYRDLKVGGQYFRSRGKRHARAYTEVRTASYEERKRAMSRAEKIQCNLTYPSFIKTMVRSHVSSCFWLGLPSRFCQDHLPSGEVKMQLEDENGSEYGITYIGRRTGLSGGWRGFSIEHNLNGGDVLIFELCQPLKFKVYIVKAVDESKGNSDEKSSDTAVGTTDQYDAKKASRVRGGSCKRVKKLRQLS